MSQSVIHAATGTHGAGSVAPPGPLRLSPLWLLFAALALAVPVLPLLVAERTTNLPEFGQRERTYIGAMRVAEEEQRSPSPGVGGRERTQAEYRALYEEAGFELTRCLPVMGELHIIEGVPA